MIKKKWFYGILFSGIFILDRISKYLALNYAKHAPKSDSLISWYLSFNRGISWGLFHSDNELLFFAVSILVTGVTVGLASYTFIRHMNHQPIIGEILVLAGSCSNLLDRFFYGGVVDFILVSYRGWSFPIFNCADVFIIIGIICILFEHHGEL
jgi:lipoprotein signal peptidase